MRHYKDKLVQNSQLYHQNEIQERVMSNEYCMFTVQQINVAAFKQCGGSKVSHKMENKEKKTHKVKK